LHLLRKLTCKHFQSCLCCMINYTGQLMKSKHTHQHKLLLFRQQNTDFLRRKLRRFSRSRICAGCILIRTRLLVQTELDQGKSGGMSSPGRSGCRFRCTPWYLQSDNCSVGLLQASHDLRILMCCLQEARNLSRMYLRTGTNPVSSLCTLMDSY
jgi:hypothetical protein